MEIIHSADYRTLSRHAFGYVRDSVEEDRTALICAATGHSPLRTYRMMTSFAAGNTTFFEKIRIVQLDEWVGLPVGHPSACAFFIRKHITEPLKIDKNRAFFFDGAAADITGEKERANRFLDREGPIDLCILGIGKNGHLGFNEPAATFSKRTHIIKLHPPTQRHQMLAGLDKPPTFGISLGITDILNSKRVLLIISGNGKRVAFDRLASREVEPAFPASALWQHGNVICLVDDRIT